MEEALKTSAIEGDALDPAAVRSSVKSQLGIPDAGLRHGQDRKADGLVEILLDATGNHDQKMTSERLFAWHAALFPLLNVGPSGFVGDLKNKSCILRGFTHCIIKCHRL
jgi:hypothetical protein